MNYQSSKTLLSFKASLLCLAFCFAFAGCSKKDLSPPPANPNPQEILKVKLEISGTQYLPSNRINTQIEYGSMDLECSDVEFYTGHVNYPHGYLSADAKNNSLVMYRDYYKPRVTCSWRLMGLGLYFYDKTGRVAIGGLPTIHLHRGYTVKLTCDFSNKYDGSCLPYGVAGNRSDLIVNIYIN